jgi:hypothetical protein
MEYLGPDIVYTKSLFQMFHDSKPFEMDGRFITQRIVTADRMVLLYRSILEDAKYPHVPTCPRNTGMGWYDQSIYLSMYI